MQLYEYEGKEVFRQFGIHVPSGGLARTPGEAAKVAEALGGKVVVKAQTLAGRRGRAGLIKAVNSPEEAREAAQNLLGRSHGEEKITFVLIEEKIAVGKELYLALTIERSANKPVLILSSEGGVEIEEIGASKPGAVIKERIDPLIGLQDFHIRRAIKKAGLPPEPSAALASLTRSLYNIFVNYQALLVEINPLVLTQRRRLIALDAKVTIDDFALKESSELLSRFGRREGEFLESQQRALEARRRGLTAYVEMEGEVAVLANGASFGMALMDLITDMGRKPSCFCDLGATPTADQVKAAISLASANPSAKVTLLHVSGGGLTSIQATAQSVAEHLRVQELRKPLVVRLNGPGQEKGVESLKAVGLEAYIDLRQALEAVFSKM